MNKNILHGLIDSLVALNDSNITDVRKEVIGTLGFALEFATVRVNIGRCAGHTEYIKRRVTNNDVVVLPNWSTARNFNPNTKVIVSILADYSKLMGCEIDTVYIDNPSRVFAEVPRVILYRELLKYGAKRFILLGD